jgi:hypothetical protein
MKGNAAMEHTNQSTSADMRNICRLINIAAARLDACATEVQGAAAMVQWSMDESSDGEQTAVLQRRAEHFRSLERFCNAGAKLLSEFVTDLHRGSMTKSGSRRLLEVVKLIAREMKREINECTDIRDAVCSRDQTAA